MDKKRARYAASLGLVAAMVAAAELLGEQEVVFPEIAALAAGMWVIDKQVWRIGRRQAVWLMTLAAAAGWLIARIPGLPPPGGIALGFLFAAGCQVLTRTSLAPMLSACLLPVALGADSPVYPVAVFLLTLTLTVILREHRLTLAPIAVVPVAAAEVGYLPIGKRPDARGELLYKITVVRDEEQRLLIV